MNLGAELMAAEIIEDLQAERKNITLSAILPYELQAEDWPDEGRERFFEAVRRCNTEKQMQAHYDDTCMARTAAFMIDLSNALIAVWNGSLGDVSIAVQLAKEKGIPVIQIDPNNL